MMNLKKKQKMKLRMMLSRQLSRYLVESVSCCFIQELLGCAWAPACIYIGIGK